MNQLRGCGTALVTPFQGDGSLDEAALRRLIRTQLAAGIDFLVPCGTTGESPVLTTEEHLRVVEITLEEARKKVPVVAGAGGNNTSRVCEMVRSLEHLGADAIVSVSPYYNKPPQEGLYRHYRAIAESTALPILIYNVPGRTGSNVEPATIARLSELSNIIGVKEASGNLTQVAEILLRVPESFLVISGDDSMTFPIMSMGGCGVISVVSNVLPQEMAEMASLCNRGDFPSARRIHFRLWPLMQALFLETNPVPVKEALAIMGLIHPVYRLPLLGMKAENRAKLEKILADLAIVKEKQYAAGGTN
ncbi:MAG: 4-hydroxy-tetrahydrodipicolinate synthase [Acidobacteria bacterium]|nr:4-hydroxy-tetrahydrodipicolinate synthase [Acidobacteriota bacterium]